MKSGAWVPAARMSVGCDEAVVRMVSLVVFAKKWLGGERPRRQRQIGWNVEASRVSARRGACVCRTAQCAKHCVRAVPATTQGAGHRLEFQVSRRASPLPGGRRGRIA